MLKLQSRNSSAILRSLKPLETKDSKTSFEICTFCGMNSFSSTVTIKTSFLKLLSYKNRTGRTRTCNLTIQICGHCCPLWTISSPCQYWFRCPALMNVYCYPAHILVSEPSCYFLGFTCLAADCPQGVSSNSPGSIDNFHYRGTVVTDL